jgi:hypothetical protein
MAIGALACGPPAKGSTHVATEVFPTNDTTRAWAFPVGEALIYRIYWGVLPVGKSRIETGWVSVSNRPMLSVRYRTKTNRFFSGIYPVDDSAETIIDPTTFLPLSFDLKLARRRGLHDEIATFNHAAGTAVRFSRLTGQTETNAIAPDTRDIISFLYYMRRFDILPRTVKEFSFMADEGFVPLRLKTLDFEDVRLPVFDAVRSLRMEPRANFGELLIEEGRVVAWVSEERRHLCTRLEIRAPLANVHIVLCQVLGPGNDMWTEAMSRHADRARCPAGDEVDRAVDDETPSEATPDQTGQSY